MGNFKSAAEERKYLAALYKDDYRGHLTNLRKDERDTQDLRDENEEVRSIIGVLGESGFVCRLWLTDQRATSRRLS